MQKVNLLGYTRPQLEELMLSMGQKKYKGGRYSTGCTAFASTTSS